MVTTIKNGDSKEIIEKSIKSTINKKGFDANKHLNTLKLDKSTTDLNLLQLNELPNEPIDTNLEELIKNLH